MHFLWVFNHISPVSIRYCYLAKLVLVGPCRTGIRFGTSLQTHMPGRTDIGGRRADVLALGAVETSGALGGWGRLTVVVTVIT